jgi:quercetin dioxygenase-like cupin family protein
MHSFNLKTEQKFDPKKHVERVLGRVGEGDVTVACWEPGQTSPYHCHPQATEIYFCFEGGGTMRTPHETVTVTAGSFVVHPPGELHEWITGPERTLLFRVRYGDDRAAPSNGQATPTGARAPRMPNISRLAKTLRLYRECPRSGSMNAGRPICFGMLRAISARIAP